MSVPLYVRRVGMCCPVGRTALTACAAIRAGVSRRRELNYLDEHGETIIGSYASFIDTRIRDQRMVTLAADALHDALGEQLGWLPQYALVLAVPETVVTDRAASPQFISLLSQSVGLELDSSRLHVVKTGRRSTGLEALRLAREIVATENRDVVICAMDSLVCAKALLELVEADRLLTADNPDGVVPGEAAACLVVSAAREQSLGVVRGIGSAEELATPDSPIPLRGQGIRKAARLALEEARLDLHQIDFRISDAAGESYAFKEQSLLTSMLRSRKMEFPLWLAASQLGDIGVAAGLVSLIMATCAFAYGYAPGPIAIILASSVGCSRTAVVYSKA